MTQLALGSSGTDSSCTAVFHVPSAKSGAQLLVGRHLVRCTVAFFVPNDKLRIMAFLVHGSWGPLMSLELSSLRVSILPCARSGSLCLVPGLAHSSNWNDSQLNLKGLAEVP